MSEITNGSFSKDDAIKQLEILTERAQEANKLLTEAQTKRELFTKNIQDKEKEAVALGVDPKKLPETLVGLEKEISMAIEELNGLIPLDLLIKMGRLDENGRAKTSK